MKQFLIQLRALSIGELIDYKKHLSKKLDKSFNLTEKKEISERLKKIEIIEAENLVNSENVLTLQ